MCEKPETQHILKDTVDERKRRAAIFPIYRESSKRKAIECLVTEYGEKVGIHDVQSMSRPKSVLCLQLDGKEKGISVNILHSVPQIKVWIYTKRSMKLLLPAERKMQRENDFSRQSKRSTWKFSIFTTDGSSCSGEPERNTIVYAVDARLAVFLPIIT